MAISQGNAMIIFIIQCLFSSCVDDVSMLKCMFTLNQFVAGVYQGCLVLCVILMLQANRVDIASHSRCSRNGCVCCSLQVENMDTVGQFLSFISTCCDRLEPAMSPLRGHATVYVVFFQDPTKQ